VELQNKEIMGNENVIALAVWLYFYMKKRHVIAEPNENTLVALVPPTEKKKSLCLWK
jgi:hypothetical protein